MPRIRRQLNRRTDLVAEQVDGIEVLRQTHEVAVVGVVSGPASALEVVHVGWPGHQAEVDVIAADGYFLRRAARCQHERRRGRYERGGHEAPVEAHDAARLVDLGAG